MFHHAFLKKTPPNIKEETSTIFFWKVSQHQQHNSQSLMEQKSVSVKAVFLTLCMLFPELILEQTVLPFHRL